MIFSCTIFGFLTYYAQNYKIKMDKQFEII